MSRTEALNLRNLDAVFEFYRRLSDGTSLPVVVQDEPVSTGVRCATVFVAA